MSNTRIEFLYRDASNYKAYNSVVVSGTFTDEQIGRIMDCLEDGMYFIPEQIDWPVERFSSITEDDHPWCELCETDFEITEQKPTITMTVDEIVSRFAAAKDNWDESKYGFVFACPTHLDPDDSELLQKSKNGMEKFIQDFAADNEWTNEHVPDQIRSFFTTWCFVYHVDTDTSECDRLLGSVYANCKLSSHIGYDDFENFMISYII